jgi:hypothetical protein
MFHLSEYYDSHESRFLDTEESVLQDIVLSNITGHEEK